MAINGSLSNKKVAFLSGLSTKLAEFLDDSKANYGKAVEGTFYLTTDTHQLYVGQKEADSANVFPVLVNSGVVTVESIKDLDPVLGSICYVTNGNILCRWNGSTWAQINPDTNTDTQPRSLSLTKSVGNDSITITGKLTTKDINGDNLPDDPNLTTSVVISGEDIGSIVTDVAVEQAVTNGSNAATIGISGTGAKANGKVATLSAGSNVSISGNASTGTITIGATDTTYKGVTTANSNKFAIADDGNAEVGALTFAAGTAMSVSTVASGTGNKNATVTFAHADVSKTTTTGTATILSDSVSKDVITGITVNDQGHITSIETTTLNAVNNDTTYHIDAISATNEGKVSITLKDAEGNGSAVLSGQDLYYKLGSASNATKVYNQGNLAEHFYLKSEIDTKFKDLNAITYKGTVSGTGSNSLPTTGVHVGDAYLVTGAALVTYDTTNNLTAKQGDLLIATGTENSSGVISSGLTWTHVPAGDDIDTTYTFSANGNNIRLQASTDPDGSAIQSVAIAGGTDLTASTSGNTITINHDAVTGGALTKNASANADSTATLTHGGSFKVIDTLTTNAQGHVTGATLKSFTLPVDNNTEYNLASLANETSIKLREAGDNTVISTINFEPISSGNITIDGSTAGTIKIGHGDISCTKTTAASATTLSTTSTNVITGITVSDQGHVTAVTTTPIKVALDNNTTYSLGGAVTAITGGVKVTDTLTDSDTNTTKSTISIVSDTLTIATGTAQTGESGRYSINVNWGSF